MKAKKLLLNWYEKNHRELPWRETRDAYRIWISEVMLQQTTVKAVIPYYEKFLRAFPNVQSLARATIEDVYELWAGLGYYSRARNLHKAAQQLSDTGFPKTHTELLEYSGFGPYTARAVASFAFGNNSGVLDGNVIRFLCRYHGLSLAWWLPKPRLELQTLADDWVDKMDSSIMNQALIEIGATICTAKSPFCFLCPLHSSCTAYQKGLQEALPLKKPRRESEIWIWEPHIFKKKDLVALTKNEYAPFLKGQWIFPGLVRKSKTRPQNFDYKHAITHHEIYVKVKPDKTSKVATWSNLQWVKIDQIKKISPVSLIQKALPFI